MQLSPISLAITRLGGVRFSPSALFATGALGAWYDPSDSTTLFEDTAGTIPSPTPGAGALSVVGKMLDKSGNGNHAIAYNTTTARPELSARVNLLTYSEQFDNAAWTKGNASVTANTSIAPDGTTTADTFTSTNTNAEHYLQPNAGASINTPNVNYTGSISVKAGTHNFVTLSMSSGNATAWAAITANLSTGQITKTGNGAAGTLVSSSIAPQGNNWYRVTFTASYASGGPGLYLWVSSSSSGTPTYGGYGVETWSAAGTETILLWGADLRPANIGTSAPAYQRIADQYTYDSNGFPRYLVFNGTASGMYTPANLNLSATDKVTVFSGVRKLGSATNVLTEFSINASANNAFYVAAPLNTSDYSFKSCGLGGSAEAITAASYAAPITNVVSGIGDISGKIAQIRVNGSVAATNTGNQGTGNFGTYLLYIGSRANSLLFLNGYIYSLIVVGAASTAAQISSTESWINVKEGTVY